MLTGGWCAKDPPFHLLGPQPKPAVIPLLASVVSIPRCCWISLQAYARALVHLCIPWIDLVTDKSWPRPTLIIVAYVTLSIVGRYISIFTFRADHSLWIAPILWLSHTAIITAKLKLMLVRGWATDYPNVYSCNWYPAVSSRSISRCVTAQYGYWTTRQAPQLISTSSDTSFENFLEWTQWFNHVEHNEQATFGLQLIQAMLCYSC